MSERLRSEQTFHDDQAKRRAAVLAPKDLRFEDADYLDHESWIRPALAQLGDVHGRRILDFGCGHGMAAVVLARRGARVIGFDLSSGYLSEARQRATANGVHVDWVEADGERLPFADGSFAGIWGNAVLHHLDQAKAAHELYRVLAPGGVAIFCEPWGENPLLAWARRRLPYPGKQRTPDEAPMRYRDLAALRTLFPGMEIRGQQLLSMASRLLGRWRTLSYLTKFDAEVIRRFPSVERYCRYVVLTLRK